MSKTAHFPHNDLAMSSSGGKRQKPSSYGSEGHHIRQMFLAATVLSWVGIAFGLRLF